MQSDIFTSLGLSPFSINRLAERNIVSPTEIQRRVIPRLFSGESFIFRSATGTGKTFAYLLPLLERLMSLIDPARLSPAGGSLPMIGEGETGENRDKAGAAVSVLRGKPLFLIAAPTFELCSQIKNEVDFLLKGAPAPIHSALLIGSAAIGRQIETLKKDRPELIVGNPGRILALVRLGKLKLRNIRFLVLDEGDRLVEDELFEESRQMVSLLKQPFQAAACSATFPAKHLQRLLPLLGIPASAGSIEDDSNEDILREKVEHWAFFSREREKPELLRSLLAALKGKRSVKVLIFTGRGSQVENIASRLRHHKLPAAGLWGGMDKTGRKQALDAFRSGAVRFLVTSDLAGRGLDIDGISHVIALDVSENRNIYIHRAGRTARAGKRGVMVSIGTEGEMRRLSALEKNLGITVYPKVLYGGRILAPDQ